MKKISNLLMMALLTVGMGLTSCDEQLDNAVTPVVDEKGEVTKIVIDLMKIDEKYLDTEKTKLVLTEGDVVELSFTILPEEMASTEVELTADDETILSIDGLKVKALKEGETKVTAKAGDKTAECTVTVKAAADPTTVTWSPVDFGSGTFTQDGVTWTPSSNLAATSNNFWDYGDNTFTTTLGKFTKIEIVCTGSYDIDGWTKEKIGMFQPEPEDDPDNWVDLYKLTWTGDAESVTIQKKDVYKIQSITFTIQ